MEEFEHMAMGEFNEEDFYETIEAPKFVDLTAPDHRPEGDDRYWFCSRVGCDQKHEEFMDSETIYKNFVLRVMAARSPSVRLRKALYRKESSVAPKCPNTVPAKPSRSRVSKLAMISSIPLETNGNIKPKEVKLVSTNKNVTPQGKKSVPKKALTEQKKQTQSPAAFRSVQNTRTMTVKLSENKVVAKALVFHSPKKLVKLKRSVELSSSVKKLCSGMRKLDIVNHKVPCKKRPLERREVKSRVFNSMRTNEKAKQKVKEKKKPVVSSDVSKAHEVNGMELENQSLSSLETLKTNKNNKLQASEDPKKNGLDKEKQYQSPETEDNENALVLGCENKENDSNAADVDRVTVVEIKDKNNELVLGCDDKDNATNAVDIDRDNDDKENSAALDNNRKMDQATYPLLKKKVIGKKETCKTTQKVIATGDKCFNGNTVLGSNRIKYTKPKLTNPKPFRLRTDERRILKEANTEKKPQSSLVKEEETTNIIELHGENLGPKLEKKTASSSRLKAYKGKSKTLVSSRQEDASENIMNGKRFVLGTKKQVASKRNETMETSKEVVTMINKSCVASGEKRHATVPKGPNFHSIHVPKSCTKRMISQV